MPEEKRLSGITRMKAGEDFLNLPDDAAHAEPLLHVGLRVEVSLLRSHHPGCRLDRDPLRDRASPGDTHWPTALFRTQVTVLADSWHRRRVCLVFSGHSAISAGIHPIFALSLSQFIPAPSQQRLFLGNRLHAWSRARLLRLILRGHACVFTQ